VVGNPTVPGDELPSAASGRRAVRRKQSSPIDRQLRFAIAHKRLIQFTYKGAQRLAEPHDYGVKNGVVKLLVYQRLASEIGTLRHGAKGWRLLEVSKIVECSVLNQDFKGSRGAQHQRHQTWDVLYARVG
jgi:hypothetical protein